MKLNFLKGVLVFLAIMLALAGYAPAQTITKDIVLTGNDGIWVDARAYSTLSAAVTAMGASVKTLVISEAITTTTNVTIPLQTELIFVKNGSITVDTGDTLTINTRKISAPSRQIFTVNGTLTIAGQGAHLNQEWFAGLADSIAAIGSTPLTLHFDVSVQTTTDHTFNKWTQLQFDGGGYIIVRTTDTLTIPANCLKYDRQRYFYDSDVFAGDSPDGIVITDGYCAYPEWWGVDGTDDHKEINAALNAITASGGVVELVPGKTYVIAEVLETLGQGLMLHGIGSVLDAGAWSPGSSESIVSIDGGADDSGNGWVDLQGVYIKGDSTVSAGNFEANLIGINAYDELINIRDVKVTGCSKGISTGLNTDRLNLVNVELDFNEYGLYSDGNSAQGYHCTWQGGAVVGNSYGIYNDSIEWKISDIAFVDNGYVVYTNDQAGTNATDGLYFRDCYFKHGTNAGQFTNTGLLSFRDCQFVDPEGYDTAWFENSTEGFIFLENCVISGCEDFYCAADDEGVFSARWVRAVNDTLPVYISQQTLNVKEGGFEEGDVAEWTLTGAPSASAADKNNGSYSCIMANNEAIKQYVSIPHGVKKIVLNFYVKNASADNGSASITTYTHVGGTSLTGATNSAVNSNGSWGREYVELSLMSERAGFLEIHILAPTAGGTNTYVDDIAVTYLY
jgi:hypothetical protein